MLSLIKGAIPGAILTWIVSTLIGANGSTGGILQIHRTIVWSHDFYWSWPLMLAATGLAAALFFMTE